MVLNIIAGQKIVTLINRFQVAGEHEIIWQPKGLPSGIYFYILQAGDFSETRKLMLQKWYSKNKAKLHPLILAIYFHTEFERIHPFVSELTSIGRSTGWDLLTGVLAGLRAVRSPEAGVAAPRAMERLAA